MHGRDDGRRGRDSGSRDRGATRGRAVLTALAMAAMAAGPGAAQEALSLERALERAGEGAYGVRIADGEARERSSGRFEALGGILPTVRLESGYMRTTDPVAAFGLNLRQRTITQADFDPAVLNRPPVGDDWVGSMVVEVPLLNADAWTGLAAADGAADAAAAAADWKEYEVRRDVVQAYYGAILAKEKVETLETASRAAAAHVRQAQLMVEQGLVTKSDVLLARVKAGEVDAQLASARGEARTAARQLATLLGTPGAVPVLPDRLPPADGVRAVVESATPVRLASVGDPVASDLTVPAPEGALDARLDVRAAREGAAAARLDVARARSARLPRVNAFGRFDWHSLDGPYRGDENWTVGIMATWTPVAGAGHVAEARAASGRRAVAEARAEAALANARLEAESTADRLSAALERLAIAERAVEHAEEAHRIVARKYEGGLATVVELLDASATETRIRLERAHATWTVIAEGAARALALGGDPGRFAALDDHTARNESE